MQDAQRFVCLACRCFILVISLLVFILSSPQDGRQVDHTQHQGKYDQKAGYRKNSLKVGSGTAKYTYIYIYVLHVQLILK